VTAPRLAKGLARGDDGLARCYWGASDPDYRAYHDLEWGSPTVDDHRLYEKLCLEGFQAGLSWLTILRKRESFRRAFAGFDPAAVARFGAREKRRLLADAGIVRHAGKIESAINNARRVLEIIDERGSFAAFMWAYEPPPSRRPRRLTLAALQKLAKTPESSALSRDLRARGFTFVGPTTLYALMQAMGMVNDHLEGCHARERVESLRASLARPSRGAATRLL
jgi:DNA-3-methyladenine glycosylase I